MDQRSVILDIKRKLSDAFGTRLKGVVLFGFLARDELTPDSDIDILMLLDKIVDLS